MKLRAITLSIAGLATVLAACAPADGTVVQSAAIVRATRRAYDGAPPVVPHEPLGIKCIECHTERGMSVDGLGFAPAMPHDATRGIGAEGRCRQCHVFSQTGDSFVPSTFVGLAQDLGHGERHHPLAPPVMPHPLFLRENCQACHTGPGARAEIRTSHPERERCTQCHLAVTVDTPFER